MKGLVRTRRGTTITFISPNRVKELTNVKYLDRQIRGDDSIINPEIDQIQDEIDTVT
jgi:hypothetical protein